MQPRNILNMTQKYERTLPYFFMSMTEIPLSFKHLGYKNANVNLFEIFPSLVEKHIIHA